MKKSLLIPLAALVAALAFGQGTLTPPGAPGATMKSLDQVEARTPISSLPFTITQSGSYYLTGSLIAPSGGSAITVTADHVTIDLNGFTLIGGTGAWNGIYQGTALRGLTVRNGTVTGFTGKSRAGVYLNGSDNVVEDVRSVDNLTGFILSEFVTVRRCEAIANNSDGFYVRGGKLTDCRAADNTGDGIQMTDHTSVENCIFLDNVQANVRISGTGNTVVNNDLKGAAIGLMVESAGNRIAENEVRGAEDNYSIVEENQVDILLCEIPETLDVSCKASFIGNLVLSSPNESGIIVNADNVTIDLNGFALVGAGADCFSGIKQSASLRNLTLKNGTITGWQRPGYCGISIDGSGSVLSGLTVSDNYVGISAGDNSVVSDCLVVDNTGIGVLGEDNWVIQNCSVKNNGAYGIYVKSSAIVTDCSITENGNDGLYVLNQGNIRNCSIINNGGDGISCVYWCTITDCIILDNTGHGVIGQAHTSIKNCRVENNEEAGLRILGSGESTIDNNYVRGNDDNYVFYGDNQLNLVLCEIPETLDWPCSVKLAGTLTCSQTATNGITVNADNVTIDLDGHAIIGPGADSGNGIYQADTFRNLRVFSGKATHWEGANVSGVCALGTGAILSDLQVSTNYYGMEAGSGSIVRDCSANANGSVGIRASNACSIQDCSAYENGDYGIYAGDNAVLSDCLASKNQNTGIKVSYGSVLENCSASENLGSSGISAGSGATLRGCTVRGNIGEISLSYGISVGGASLVEECSSFENRSVNTPAVSTQGVGIYSGTGSTIRNCTVSANQGDGIRIYGDGSVSGCTCDNNGFNGDGAGIRVLGSGNRIDSNNASDNDRGIYVTGSGNIIIRNTASDNTSNYGFVSGNMNAEVLTPGSSFAATNPWANFSF